MHHCSICKFMSTCQYSKEYVEFREKFFDLILSKPECADVVISSSTKCKYFQKEELKNNFSMLF